MQLGLAGYFKIEAIRPDGTKRVLADWFPNLILNAGLNRLGTGGTNGLIDGVAVGSGSSAPAETQTTLDSLIAYSTSDSGHAGVSGSTTTHYWGGGRATYRFAIGVAAGNLSEVGVGWSSTGLFSRALILDGNGQPTTITVLSDEILDVTYELRNYQAKGDSTTTIELDGVTYDVTIRPANYGCGGRVGSQASRWDYNSPTSKGILFSSDSYDGDACWSFLFLSDTIKDESSSPAKTTRVIPSVVNETYVQDSFSCTGTATLDYLSGNFVGGINSALIGPGFGYTAGSNWIFAYWQVGFSPSIPKQNTQKLTMTFKTSWGRFTP